MNSYEDTSAQKHKKIYKTKRWQKVRKAVIFRDKGICYFCGKLISGRANVHHLVELTDQNYLDENIAFGMDNLVTCHHECHNEYHERFGLKPSIVQDDLSIDYGRRKV